LVIIRTYAFWVIALVICTSLPFQVQQYCFCLVTMNSTVTVSYQIKL